MTTGASITLPAAELRWQLSGPPSVFLDTLVAGLIGARVGVEPIKPSEGRYRLSGPFEILTVLADELGKIEGYSLVHEQAPTESIGLASTLAPLHAPRRNVTIHGTGTAASLVARAIDRGLIVSTVGINRWSVTGPSSALVQWLAASLDKPTADVLTMFSWTVESVELEDTTPTPPIEVNVALPDRRITSQITRDGDGGISQIIQLETNAP